MKVSFFFFLLLIGNLLSAQCDGWKFAEPVTINNSLNPDTLTDFQVLVTINTEVLIPAKMQPDGADIRFAYQTPCNFLAHFIESGIDTKATKIWVKVPVIPAGEIIKIWLTYGNPTELNTSNGDSTFSFFDGFATPPIKFTNCGDPMLDETPGQLKINWSNAGLVSIISEATFSTKDDLFTGEMKVDSCVGYYPAISWYSKKDGKGYSLYQGIDITCIGKSDINNIAFCHPVDPATSTTPRTTSTGIWSITWKETGAIIANTPGEASIFSLDTTYSRKGGLRLCVGTVGNGAGYIALDWVRVRKYTDKVPVVTFGK